MGSLVLDQDFTEPDRHDRLRRAIEASGLAGVGVDEDTAAILTTGDARPRLAGVVGRVGVTVVDDPVLRARVDDPVLRARVHRAA